MTLTSTSHAITETFRNIPDSELNAKSYDQSGIHFEAVIPETALLEAAGRCRDLGYFLETLTVIDFSEVFELVYLFNEWSTCFRFAVKVLLPKTQSARSIVSIWPAANWFEREIYDMYGIHFQNHPNLTRLLLPANSKIHPLLKSFKGEPDGSDLKQVQELLRDYKEGYEITYPQDRDKYNEVYHINVGPQHPSTHGVLRLLLKMAGERVLAGEPIIGYVHRNHEKMAEIQEYKAFWPNMGRLDYVGAMSYNFGYAGLIERAMGIRVSERVEYIRVLLTELNRISSHLLWLGTYLLDLGAYTPFFYCFDDRERILDILENVTGERLTYDYFRFGGLECDIPEELIRTKVHAFIPHFEKRLRDYNNLVGENIIFRKRTEGVGVLTKQTALHYGVTGPALRASGVRMDLRRQEPYSIYPRLDFEIPVEKEGDAYARYRVRSREMQESLRLVEQIIDRIPSGDVKTAKLPRTVPKGEYYFAVESARGSFGMYLVSDGSPQPYKIKLRTPSFSNLSALESMIGGCYLADVISILGSIDVVIPEIDR